MRIRAHTSFLFLLILSFLLVDVSVSISFAKAPGLLTKSKQIPQYLKQVIASKWASNVWNKLKSLFNGPKARIGDIVDGLWQVQDYLVLFGYLNSTLHSNFTNEYTENAKSAIEEFQKNYNLQVTGQLDKNLYHVLSQPRCGVPDIINGTTTMNSGKANTTVFKPWWKAGVKELTYAFDPQNNVTDGVRSLFRDAFDRWSKVTSLNFTETTTFNTSDIEIAFVALDGKGGNVGFAYTNYNNVHAGGIYLDAEEEWVMLSQELTQDEVDLESVVMHEIGHLLGLGHSSVEQAIMYPIVLQEKKIDLANDDLQRIHQINQVNNSGHNNGSASSHGTNSSGGVADYVMRHNLILAFTGAFAFMVLGFC